MAAAVARARRRRQKARRRAGVRPGERAARRAQGRAAPLRGAAARHARGRGARRATDWLHELKFDGYRILCRLQDGKARLLSRNGKDWTEQFEPVAARRRALPRGAGPRSTARWPWSCPTGRPASRRCRTRCAARAAPRLAYFAFDLLHLDGYDLTRAPLEDARKRCGRRPARAAAGRLRYSDHVVGLGPRLPRAGLPHEARRDHQQAPRRALRNDARPQLAQGEVRARAGVRDRRLHRSRGLARRASARCCSACTTAAGSRSRARWAPASPTRARATLRKRLDALEQKTQPVRGEAAPGVARAHWVKPELVAEVKFTEWTGRRPPAPSVVPGTARGQAGDGGRARESRKASEDVARRRRQAAGR